MNEEKDYLILRTYNTVWKIDRKIYSVEGFKLLIPLSANEALYAAVSIGISILLVKVIPFYKNLHFFIKFGVVPFGLMKFLTKQKLDGKLPHKFFMDYVMYIVQPKRYSRFYPIDSDEKVKFETNITFRQRGIVNKTNSILVKENKKIWNWGK